MEPNKPTNNNNANTLLKPENGVYIFENDNNSNNALVGEETGESAPQKRKPLSLEEQVEGVLSILRTISSPQIVESMKFSEYEHLYFQLKAALEAPMGFNIAMHPQIFPYLEQGLAHAEYEGLRRLGLFQLQRCALQTKHHGLFDEKRMRLLWCILLQPEIKTADMVGDIFVNLGKTGALQTVFADQGAWKQALSVSSEIKFRLLTVICRLAALSDLNFEFLAHHSYLQMVLDVFENEDPLEILNAIELLDQLTYSTTVCKFLEEKKILQTCASLAFDDTNPLYSLFGPRLIGFFGQLAERGAFQAQFVLNQTKLFSALQQALEQSYSEIQFAAISAITRIATTPSGFAKLNEKGLLDSLTDLVNTSLTDLRNLIFSSLGYLLTKTSQKPESLKMKELLTKNTTKGLASIVVSYLDTPFEQDLLTAFTALDGLTKTDWGSREALGLPGFYEFLTNRKRDVPKMMHEWKYEIVRNLLEHGRESLNPQQSAELKLFIAQGIVFVPPETQVEVASKFE